MTYEDYLQLIENNPRIVFAGFKKRVPGFPRYINQACDALEREHMKNLFSLFSECCDYIRWRGRFPKKYFIAFLKMDMEHRLWKPLMARPDIHQGVLTLALVHEGFVIRQCRGETDGRIIRRKP
jgi:hypothetical protein